MKYKVGDTVVYKYKDMLGAKDSYIHQYALISDANHSYLNYYAYSTRHTSITIKENEIISCVETRNVITNTDIFNTLNPETSINGFYKTVMIHLINKSDNYDLQILNKCNHLLNSEAQTIINLINSKVSR